MGAHCPGNKGIKEPGQKDKVHNLTRNRTATTIQNVSGMKTSLIGV